MRCLTGLAAACLLCTSAAAMDLPTRKAGEWEVKMEFANSRIPARTMKQCIDAASDKLMNSLHGGSNDAACSKRDISSSGATMVVDSVCSFGGGTVTSHAVVTGSFDSAYTVDVTSTRQGGAAPGMPATGSTHMKIAAKWLGPCPAGEKPGDMVMPNGMKVNVLDLQKRQPPPAR